MLWLIWAIPLTIVVFLWTGNEYLQGLKKRSTRIALMRVWLALWVVAFLISGWKIALVASVCSILLIIPFAPIAHIIARRLIKYPALGVREYNLMRALQDVAGLASGQNSWQPWEEGEEREHHMESAVRKAMRRRRIRSVLEAHCANRQDLEALYRSSYLFVVPPWVREKALRNPKLVEFFLEVSVPGEFLGKYVRNVTSIDMATLLQVWVVSDPGRKEPPH